jgi:lipid kinase, YegS/Rv2252/BmrU family
MDGKDSAFPDGSMITFSQRPSAVHTAPNSSRLRDVLLIVNPGSRNGGRLVPHVLNALGTTRVRVVETTAPRHATTIVRDLLSAGTARFDAILTLGGDGTAMEVATALAEFPDAPPLGIIAQGTANILARTLGIPMNPVRAVDALLDSDVVTIDLGAVEGGPAFAIGLGIGLDATMIAGASAKLKRRFGYLAYGISALAAGLRLERFTATITVDGTSHVVEASSILVANFGSVLGNLLCFGEDIGHHDGVLDVCIYSPRNHVDAARIFWRMLRGGMVCDPNVRIVRGRNIRIETDRPRLVQADGELIGSTPATLRVMPRAVRMLVPRRIPRRWRLPHLGAVRTVPQLLQTCSGT